MIWALITGGLLFEPKYLITRGLDIGEAADVPKIISMVTTGHGPGMTITGKAAGVTTTGRGPGVITGSL